MSRSRALELIKERNQINLHRQIFQFPFWHILLLLLVVACAVSLVYAILTNLNSVPATASAIVLVLFFIWLGWRQKKIHRLEAEHQNIEFHQIIYDAVPVAYAITPFDEKEVSPGYYLFLSENLPRKIRTANYETHYLHGSGFLGEDWQDLSSERDVQLEGIEGLTRVILGFRFFLSEKQNSTDYLKLIFSDQFPAFKQKLQVILAIEMDKVFLNIPTFNNASDLYDHVWMSIRAALQTCEVQDKIHEAGIDGSLAIRAYSLEKPDARLWRPTC
jgi:hypothetical protein